MAEILSQEEIDALLKSDIVEKTEAVKTPIRKREKKLIPYDFKRPDRFSKDQLRIIRSIHEKMARSFSSSLSARLRMITEVNLISVEQLTYGEFLLSLPDPTCFSIISLSPLSGSIILEINPSVVFPIIDKLMGGTGISINISRELTEIEQEIMKEVIELILSDLKEAWRPIIELEFKLETVETSPHIYQIVPTSEIVALVAFEVRVGENSGMMNLCIPAIVLEPIRDRMEAQDWFMIGGHVSKKAHENREFKSIIEKLVMKTTLNLEVIINNTAIPIRELLELKKGDILPFSTKVKEHAILKIEGREKYKCLIGVSGRKKAIQIVDIVKEEE